MLTGYAPNSSDTSSNLSETATRLISNIPLRSQSIARRRLSTNNTTSPRFPEEFGKDLTHQRTGCEPLGLQLISDNGCRKGDIIFVHGLGGSAWKSWSWNRDTSRFWPKWLTERDEFASWRLFTFGYNANWRGPSTILNISDFAKDLLLQMLTFTTDDGLSTSPIGTAPIIFVAHSMGGLVVKKAYLFGMQDPQFTELVSRIHGIMFLATPHRGSQLASTLNNILASTPLGPPPKAYVNDLQLQSNTLQEINEQFRHHCGDLELVSFFETNKTSFGVMKSIVSILHLI